MRNKRVLNFITDNDLLRLNRDGLATSGMAVADVTAREQAPSGGELSGVNIVLDGAGDKEPACKVAVDPTCDGVGNTADVRTKYNNYTMEVVQQIGSDSFSPGHGVLISKTKNTAFSCGLSSCFVWVVDAHPEDINKVDFVAADGTVNKATIGDERQKNDASFNVGLNSGTLSEYEDTANRLHFYILDKHTDATGILHYTVGVRSLDGAGPQTRGVALATPQLGNDSGYATCSFNLKNTGASATVPAGTHPQDASAYLEQRHLPPVGVGHRHRLRGIPQEPVRDRQVRRLGLGPGLHRQGHRRRQHHADGDVGERSDQDRHTALHVRRLDGRRLGSGHAGPDDGRRGVLRPVHPGSRQGLLRLDHGHRRLDGR